MKNVIPKRRKFLAKDWPHPRKRWTGSMNDGLHSTVVYLYFVFVMQPNPVAARSREWVCGRSLAGIVGSNATGGMAVCLL